MDGKIVLSLQYLLSAIKQIVNKVEDAVVIRFMFNDINGNIKSITLPTSRFTIHDNSQYITLDHDVYKTYYSDQSMALYQKTLDVLEIQCTYEIDTSLLVLLPDANTTFMDPCSVQPTLCAICSVVQRDELDAFIPVIHDARSILHCRSILYPTTNNNTSYCAKCDFALYDLNCNGTSNGESMHAKCVDVFHDLRSDVMLEMLKAGVNVESHCALQYPYCRLVFSSNSTLAFADSIQKCKTIIRNIAASYGKFVVFDTDNMHSNSLEEVSLLSVIIKDSACKNADSSTKNKMMQLKYLTSFVASMWQDFSNGGVASVQHAKEAQFENSVRVERYYNRYNINILLPSMNLNPYVLALILDDITILNSSY